MFLLGLLVSGCYATAVSDVKCNGNNAMTFLFTKTAGTAISNFVLTGCSNQDIELPTSAYTVTGDQYNFDFNPYEQCVTTPTRDPNDASTYNVDITLLAIRGENIGGKDVIKGGDQVTLGCRFQNNYQVESDLRTIGLSGEELTGEEFIFAFDMERTQSDYVTRDSTDIETNQMVYHTIFSTNPSQFENSDFTFKPYNIELQKKDDPTSSFPLFDIDMPTCGHAALNFEMTYTNGEYHFEYTQILLDTDLSAEYKLVADLKLCNSGATSDECTAFDKCLPPTQAAPETAPDTEPDNAPDTPSGTTPDNTPDTAPATSPDTVPDPAPQSAPEITTPTCQIAIGQSPNQRCAKNELTLDPPRLLWQGSDPRSVNTIHEINDPWPTKEYFGLDTDAELDDLLASINNVNIFYQSFPRFSTNFFTKMTALTNIAFTFLYDLEEIPDLTSQQNTVTSFELKGSELLDDADFAQLATYTFSVAERFQITTAKLVNNVHAFRLPAVKIYQLTHTKIPTIDKSWFANCNPLVESLQIEYGEATSIEYDTFSGHNSNLKHLHLTANRLTSIPNGLFAGMGQLQTLYLQQNSLQSVQALYNSAPSLPLLNNLNISYQRDIVCDSGATNDLQGMVVGEGGSVNYRNLDDGIYNAYDFQGLINFVFNCCMINTPNEAALSSFETQKKTELYPGTFNECR